MQSFKFSGYLTEVYKKSQYDIQFILCDVKDPSAPDVKFPQMVLFRVSTKREELVAMIEACNLNDKIEVEFFPWSKKGMSKRTNLPYCITENNVSKVKVVERAKVESDADATGDELALPI